MTEILATPLQRETGRLSRNLVHVALIPAPGEVCWEACDVKPSQEQTWSG